MTYRQFELCLIQNGWNKINTNIKEFSLYSTQTNNMNYIVGVLDDCSNFLTHPLLLEHILEQSEPFASKQKLPYQMLCIVLTNEVARTKTMMEGIHSKWLFDMNSNKLIIFENQPSEFLNLRPLIENICNPDSAHSDFHTNTSHPILYSIKQGFLSFWKSNTAANFSIIALNLLVFLITELIGDTKDPYFMHLCGAISSSDILISHEYFRTISSTFLHFGFEHLFSNMIVLWALGTALERLVGSIRYTAIYLISGIGANIISMLWYWYTREYYVVSAGASGAIFGVVGALLYIILRNKGRVNGIGSRQLIWLCIFTFFHGISSIGINNTAHLGGLLAGILCGVIFYRHNR